MTDNTQNQTTLSRRDFSRVVGATITTAMIGRFSHPGLFAAEKEKSISPGYIDVHTHIGTYTNGNKELKPSQLVKWMDEHSIAQAVVLPLVSPESTTYLQPPDRAIAAAKQFPDRLIPFCCIDPRSIVRGGVKGLIGILQKYVDQGAKGFGEHKVGLNFDDPLMMRVYEACEAVGIPLLFHLDTVRGKDEPGLPRLENALKSFPKLNFIGHGPGWWASISGGVKTKADLGGYPKAKVEQGGAIDRLMEKYPNIYGDLSAGSGANSIGRDLEFGKEFLIRRQDRILFGTDYLQPGQQVPQFDLFEKKLDLPNTVRTKIYHDNVKRILKLS